MIPMSKKLLHPAFMATCLLLLAAPLSAQQAAPPVPGPYPATPPAPKPIRPQPQPRPAPATAVAAPAPAQPIPAQISSPPLPGTGNNQNLAYPQAVPYWMQQARPVLPAAIRPAAPVPAITAPAQQPATSQAGSSASGGVQAGGSISGNVAFSQSTAAAQRGYGQNGYGPTPGYFPGYGLVTRPMSAATQPAPAQGAARQNIASVPAGQTYRPAPPGYTAYGYGQRPFQQPYGGWQQQAPAGYYGYPPQQGYGYGYGYAPQPYRYAQQPGYWRPAQPVQNR